jgi:hypothetical protein
MRNPLANSQISNWMKQAPGSFRSAVQRGRSADGQSGFVTGGIRVLLVCVLLIGGIAAMKLVRLRNSNDEVKTVMLTIPAPQIAPTAVDNEQKTQKSGVVIRHKAAAAKGEPRNPEEQKPVVASAETPRLALPVIQPKPVVLGPPVVPPTTEPEEKENSDIARLRASWFFDQRAYPFQHIPEGALQRAIEQRDLMRAQQRAVASSKVTANAIINFPGDALWHLMGPPAD